MALPTFDVIYQRGRLVTGTMNYGTEYELDGRRYLVAWSDQRRQHEVIRELAPEEWDGAWAP